MTKTRPTNAKAGRPKGRDSRKIRHFYFDGWRCPWTVWLRNPSTIPNELLYYIIKEHSQGLFYWVGNLLSLIKLYIDLTSYKVWTCWLLLNIAKKLILFWCRVAGSLGKTHRFIPSHAWQNYYAYQYSTWAINTVHAVTAGNRMHDIVSPCPSTVWSFRQKTNMNILSRYGTHV